MASETLKLRKRDDVLGSRLSIVSESSMGRSYSLFYIDESGRLVREGGVYQRNTNFRVSEDENKVNIE